MPLVSFRPTKARLIIEESKASVLVMKVVVQNGESVKLATGGKLEELAGTLRIRSRDATSRNGNGGPGTLVYIAEAEGAADPTPAKFQINIAMAATKFDELVRFALSGRLPTKFFVDAGERISRTETRGLAYEVRAGKRNKYWDTLAHQTLLVTNFTFILPIDVPAAPGVPAPPHEEDSGPSLATNAQVAELIDDLLVFHGETRHTLLALMAILGILAVAALVIGLMLFQRA
ncbi:MAG TPA: hypothetical protein PLW68_10010 [Casimicrobiaceae bacterium]|nr:hypothetical protein [Casimicrobiaceae bacterium]